MAADYEEGRRLRGLYLQFAKAMAGEGDVSDELHEASVEWEIWLEQNLEALLNPDPWRPIEEMPEEWKDGRDVCVSDGLGVYGNARWHPTEECWLNCDGCVPTHFRELKGPGQ